jgi:hypothetical protein
MAESALRKALIKKFQLPGTRKGFIDEFDGNVDGLSRLQMDIDSSGDEAMIQFFQNAVDNSGGTDEGIVEELVNILYPQKTGARGKTAPVAEKVESNLPTGTADQGALDATPYESLSNTNKTKLTAAGFPAADVSTWSAEDLWATLASIDGTRKTGGKKSTAGKTAGSKASTKAAAKQAEAAPAAKPADKYADVEQYLDSAEAPIPGTLGTSQADLDSLEDPIPGAMGLTRADVPGYDNPAGMFNEMDAPIEAPPPAMDMAALGGLPSLEELLARMQPAAPAATPSSMDMNALSNLPSREEIFAPPPVDVNTLDLSDLLGEGYPPRPMQGPYRDNLRDPNTMELISPEADPALPGTTLQDGSFLGQMQGPPAFNEFGGFGSANYGPPLPPGFNRPGDTPPQEGKFRPVGSRVEQFMKARGLGGVNTAAVTGPVDFTIRNAPLIGAGLGAAAAMRAANQGSGVTQEQMEGATNASEQSEQILNSMFGPEAMEMYKQRAVQQMQQETQGRSL